MPWAQRADSMRLYSLNALQMMVQDLPFQIRRCLLVAV